MSTALLTDKNRVNRLVSVLQNKVPQFVHISSTHLSMYVCEKYAEISTAYMFLPIAVETLFQMNESTYLFFEINKIK